jgi:gustatory receptor
LKRKIRFIATVLLSLALYEHIMSWSSFLYERFFQMKACKWEIGSMFFYIATTHLRQIYAEIPATFYSVSWAEYMNVSFTFTWNFLDLLIIMISMGIAAKFQKINRRLEFFRGRVSYA